MQWDRSHSRESKDNLLSSKSGYALIKGIDNIPKWSQSGDFPFTNLYKLNSILGN